MSPNSVKVPQTGIVVGQTRIKIKKSIAAVASAATIVDNWTAEQSSSSKTLLTDYFKSGNSFEGTRLKKERIIPDSSKRIARFSLPTIHQPPIITLPNFSALYKNHRGTQEKQLATYVPPLNIIQQTQWAPYQKLSVKPEASRGRDLYKRASKATVNLTTITLPVQQWIDDRITIERQNNVTINADQLVYNQGPETKGIDRETWAGENRHKKC